MEDPKHVFDAGVLAKLGRDPEHRRAIAAGAARVHARITADLEREYARLGDALAALAVVTDREVAALAASGRGHRAQDACRVVVAYIGAPLVAAALLADEVPDTIEHL